MPTMQQMTARANRQAAETLARNFAAMPADKQTWRPLDQGRPALDQVVECAVTNQFAERTLRTCQIDSTAFAGYEQARAEHDTGEKALAFLAETAAALADAIESFPSEHLGDPVTLPWETTPTTLAEMMLVPYWNTTYHLGQICYIQTLYGDKEYH